MVWVVELNSLLVEHRPVDRDHYEIENNADRIQQVLPSHELDIARESWVLNSLYGTVEGSCLDQ